MLPGGLALGHFNVAAGLWSAIMVTYAAAYAEWKPWEQPYGLSFAMADAAGLPRAPTTEELALVWSDGSGIPPTAGVTLISEGPAGVRRADPFGSLELALAFAPDRLLALTRVSPRLPKERSPLLARIRAGHAAAAMNGAIGARPVVMLHGRADGLIPVNHSSRAYYAVAQNAGPAPDLRYYEIVHGQHFDAYLGLPGFRERYVPLQPWIGRSLDLVLECLTGGASLPPSQVLRSRPRAAVAGDLAPLSASDLGDLKASPGGDGIGFRGATLTVPT